MATRQRPIDAGRERGRELRRVVGWEIRNARRALGLSLASVSREVGISISELGRVERALAPWVSIQLISEICAVVGLELSARAYPGGRSLRDARHAAILGRLRAIIDPSLRWRTEVPLPLPGDLRAWDATVSGTGWFYGVEAEMNPVDGQAVVRRLQLKMRDGGANGVILLLPDTRATRAFRHAYAELLAADSPIRGSVALERLAAGADPRGSAIVVL